MFKAPVLWLFLACAAVATSKPVSIPEDEIIDVDEEFMAATTPAMITELNDWKDWESWIPPAKIVKLAPYYRAGYDYDGLPVHVMEYGKWNYRELATLSPEELKDFYKYFKQLSLAVSRDGASNDNQGMVFILDWEGFALKNFASKSSLEVALRNFVEIVTLNQSMKYAFNINTNFAAETFLNLARPFLGNILEKIEIYGTRSAKWKPALARKIPQNQLPPVYGGNSDWKPLPLTSS